MKWIRALVVGGSAAVLSAGMAAGSAAGAVSSAGPPGGGVMLRAARPADAPTAVGNVTQEYSSNWSGYAEQGTKKQFTAVEGTWTVQAAKASSGATYSSDWVGIDGATNTKLVQDGTEADYYSGAAHYDAWTEIIPASEVVLSGLTVKPGNKMEGIVQEITTNKWTMTVKNLSTGKSASRTVSYTTPEADAEAIHERPEIGGSLANLAQTANVTQLPDYYSTAAPGATPVWKDLGVPVGGTTINQIFMVNNADTAIIASPSALNSAKDGFTVADGSTSPPPPS
jgi:hypothetical protein